MNPSDLFPRNTELLLFLYQAHEDRTSEGFVKIPAKWLLDALQKANLEMTSIRNSDMFPLVMMKKDYIAIPIERVMDRPLLISKMLDYAEMAADIAADPMLQPAKPKRRSAAVKGKAAAGKGKASAGKGEANAAKGKGPKRR